MRRRFDAYLSQEQSVTALLPYFEAQPDDVIYEPCCGYKHVIARTLWRAGYKRIFLNDLDETVRAHRNINAAHFIKCFEPRPDWICTNPPFSEAMGILRQAWEHARCGVIFQLRLSFLEPTFERQEFLEKFPPDRLLVLPRYSFTENGKTDSVTTAWMMWHKYPVQPFIKVIPKFAA